MTADQLRAYRASFGLSQRAAADLLGVHWRTLQNWETAAVPMPGPMAKLWAYVTIGLTVCDR